MSLLLFALLLVCTVALIRVRPPAERWDVHASAAARWAPVALGAVSAAIAWWIWGSLRAVPAISDEAAYLFQAKLFASGQWAMPTPPLPEFFEQANLILSPTFASKYPPGHSLLLALGVLVGLPGLLPVLLIGASGGLLFALARRIADRWVALGAWLLWATAPINVTFQPSYFSEIATGALWLAAWWALLEWRAHRQRRWLLALAVCVAWACITRPLTAVALALPISVVVIRDVIARRTWRDLAIASCTGLAVLAIVPLWSARTTGSWRTTPFTLHTRDYLPFVHLGFGSNGAPAARPQPRDMEAANAEFQTIHREHTLSALPQTLTKRVLAIGTHVWRGSRAVLVPFAIVAIVVVCAEGAFALLSALLLVGIYLLYAHPPEWTLYYLEILPLLAFLSALGVVRVAEEVASRLTALRRTAFTARATPRAVAAVALTILLLPGSVARVRTARSYKARQLTAQATFRARLNGIAAEKAVVFVRYAPRHNVHFSLIDNDPDLASSRVWTVHHRGADDARLMMLARDRAAFLFDEASGDLMPMSLRTAERD
jgi:hypothetical protein